MFTTTIQDFPEQRLRPALLVGAQVDYGLDLAAALGDATITAVQVAATTGLTVLASGYSGAIVTTRLSSAADGDYELLIEAALSDGQRLRVLARVQALPTTLTIGPVSAGSLLPGMAFGAGLTGLTYGASY